MGAAHVSLAFDLFETEPATVPTTTVSDPRPLHAWGLLRTLERRSVPEADLEWMTYAAPELGGEASPEKPHRQRSPAPRRSSHGTRHRASAWADRAIDWPVLKTRLSAEDRVRVEHLHEHSDWVVTLDRNAALDYFDSPQQSPDAYERFVIDTVPERSDLAAIQLVTSTTNLDAVRDLVDEALGDMGLSSSERNSRFLVNQLKALSGRLAIRLADGGTQDWRAHRVGADVRALRGGRRTEGTLAKCRAGRPNPGRRDRRSRPDRANGGRGRRERAPRGLHPCERPESRAVGVSFRRGKASTASANRSPARHARPHSRCRRASCAIGGWTGSSATRWRRSTESCAARSSPS